MQIIKTQRFKIELQNIMEFIAQDNLERALDFERDLDKRVEDLINFPYQCRQSFKSTDKNIRELVFNSYVIPYKIYENKILILGVFNQNEWELQ